MGGLRGSLFKCGISEKEIRRRFRNIPSERSRWAYYKRGGWALGRFSSNCVSPTFLRNIHKPAYKPGFVSPSFKDGQIAIYLGERLPERSSDLPEGQVDRNQSFPLIWPCSRWGLPSQPVARLLVGSYIKEFTFPRHFTLTLLGRYLSVALSLPFSNKHKAYCLGRWELPTTVSCGARTFLFHLATEIAKQQRLSSQLVNNSSILAKKEIRLRIVN